MSGIDTTPGGGAPEEVTVEVVNREADKAVVKFKKGRGLPRAISEAIALRTALVNEGFRDDVERICARLKAEVEAEAAAQEAESK